MSTWELVSESSTLCFGTVMDGQNHDRFKSNGKAVIQDIVPTMLWLPDVMICLVALDFVPEVLESKTNDVHATP